MSERFRSNKRPNYFTGQLLGEEDFQAEQKYHLDLRRGHDHYLHLWGVVLGLEAERVDNSTVLIKPGSAIDGQGRLIVLNAPQNLLLHPREANSSVFLTMSYTEDFEDADRSTDNSQNYTRCSELSVFDETLTAPPDDGSVVVLAKVLFASGKISSLDTSMRHLAGARIAPGSVTLSKLGAELRSGWVRMPFKPSSLVDPETAALDFFIGATRTWCDHRGAQGTMAIPIPMLADHLKTFVIAGGSNDVQIKIELYRCGWDTKLNQHERTVLLDQKIPAKEPFYESYAINKSLDANQCLAVHLKADGGASISLIAAEFEYALGKQ